MLFSTSRLASPSEYVQSSTANISTIKQRLGNTKNLLTGALTAEDYRYGFLNARGAFSKQGNAFISSDGYIARASDGVSDLIISPNFYLEQGKYYTLSFDSIGEEGDTGYEAQASLNTRGGTAITLIKTGNHYVGTFQYNGKSGVINILAFYAYKIYHPQLEEGSTETSFETGDVTSQIKQTADSIIQRVADDEGDIAQLQITANGLTSVVSSLKAGNMLTGVLDGTGWRSASGSMTPYAITEDVVDNWIKHNSGDLYVVTPNVSIKKNTKYTISFDVASEVTSAIEVYIHSGSGVPSAISLVGATEPLMTGTSGRRKVTFEPAANATAMILVKIDKLRYPQLEIGTEATDFKATSSETVSQIKQTANEIEQLVNDTGVDITNGKINLYADKVKFYKNKASAQAGDTAKIWIDGSDGSLHAVDGEFSGKIVATSGTIGGFEIGSTSIQSADTNHNIVLNNSGAAKIGGFEVAANGTASLKNTLTVGNTNSQRIEIVPFANNTFGAGSINFVNMYGDNVLALGFDSDNYGYIKIEKPATISDSLDSYINIKNNQIRINSLDTDDNKVTNIYVMTALESAYSLYSYDEPSTNQKLLKVGIDTKTPYLRAYDVNGNSAWPVALPSSSPGMTKGLVHTLTLDNLKYMLDNYNIFRYFFSKVSIMVAQTS
jgi:hypothetical protein